MATTLLFGLSVWTDKDGQAGKSKPKALDAILHISQFEMGRQEALSKIGQEQMSFGGSNALGSFFGTPAEPLLHPTCDPCPPYCNIKLSVDIGERKIVCVNSPTKEEPFITWHAGSIPMGLLPKIEVERQIAIGECQYPIVLDLWNGRIDTLTRSIPIKWGDIACVDDLKGDGSEFDVRTVPGLGWGRINNLRINGRCKLTITTRTKTLK